MPCQYVNHLHYYLRTVLHLENFLMFGKKVILFQSIKTGINNKKLATGVFITNLRKINGKTYVQLNFIDTRNMLSVHQSGFRPGDSCVHQLILIVHDICNAFDANPSLEVRGVFLGIKVYYINLNAWV